MLVISAFISSPWSVAQQMHQRMSAPRITARPLGYSTLWGHGDRGLHAGMNGTGDLVGPSRRKGDRLRVAGL